MQNEPNDVTFRVTQVAARVSIPLGASPYLFE